jgi:hypothetical protein
MVSPVSVGDVFLVGILALKLACAFTKGRKPAPGRVREVENQLYSLNVALSALERVRTEGDAGMPMLKRWNRILRDNWKKFAWTTEGGDLATLRSQLSVHINSLNLVVGLLLRVAYRLIDLFY